jgi:hypothetical protein
MLAECSLPFGLSHDETLRENQRVPKLKQIVDDYQRLMPGWFRVAAHTLGRVDGPLFQGIGFECLSTGDYRPMNYVNVLVAPQPDWIGDGSFFAQFPRGRPITVSLQEHAQLHDSMFHTMQSEFLPPMNGPFDAGEMLDLCEKNAVPKSFQAYALAALNAYFGKDGRARYWSARFPLLVEELAFPWEPWDFRRKAFLDSLQGWLDEGIAKPKLEEILAAEKAKWGLR